MRLMSSATRRSVTTSAPSDRKKVESLSAASVADARPNFSARERTGCSCRLTTIREKESAEAEVLSERMLKVNLDMVATSISTLAFGL